jgi:hypothetical protein
MISTRGSSARSTGESSATRMSEAAKSPHEDSS